MSESVNHNSKISEKGGIEETKKRSRILKALNKILKKFKFAVVSIKSPRSFNSTVVEYTPEEWHYPFILSCSSTDSNLKKQGDSVMLGSYGDIVYASMIVTEGAIRKAVEELEKERTLNKEVSIDIRDDFFLAATNFFRFATDVSRLIDKGEKLVGLPFAHGPKTHDHNMDDDDYDGYYDDDEDEDDDDCEECDGDCDNCNARMSFEEMMKNEFGHMGGVSVDSIISQIPEENRESLNAFVDKLCEDMGISREDIRGHIVEMPLEPNSDDLRHLDKQSGNVSYVDSYDEDDGETFRD